MEQMLMSRQNQVYPIALRAMAAWFSMLGSIAPGLAARLAYHMWFTPHRLRTPSREKPWFQTARRQFINVNKHCELAVYQWGEEGPRILLMHGWNGRATQLGAFIEPLVSAGYQVLAFDCPAHGYSSGRQTNLFDIAHALHAVSARFGPFEGIIAHSFGVAVSVYAMRHLGVATRRIVCLSPPGRISYLFNQFCEMLHLPLRTRASLERRMLKNFGRDIWEQISPDANAELLDDVQALLIHDDQDRDVSLNQGRILRESWPGARLLRTSGLGHRQILRDPEVIDTTLQFLQNGQYPAAAE